MKDRQVVVSQIIRVLFYSITLSAVILIFFGVGAASSRVTDENIFTDTGNFSRIEVIQVVDGGASDKAGMLVGDIITKINGQEFRNASAADQILRNYRGKSAMIYDIERNGEAMQLSVHAVNQKLQLHHVASFLFIVFAAVFAIFIDLKRSAGRGVTLFKFAFMLHALTLASSTLFVLGGINFAPLAVGGQIASIVGMPLFTHAIAYLPRSEKLSSFERKLVWINYLLCAFVIVLIIFIVPRGSNLSIFLGNVVLVGIHVIIAFLLATHLKGEARRARFIQALCLAFSFIGILLFQINFAFLRYVEMFLLVAFSILPITFYLTVRYRYFDILTIIRKNFQYQAALNFYIITAIFGSLSLVTLVTEIDLGNLSFRVSPTQLEVVNSPRDGFTDRPFFVIAGVLITLSLGWFSRRFKRWLNHKFSREDYNYRRALTEFSAEIAAQLRLEDVYSTIVSQLEIFMPVKGVALVVRAEGGFELAALSGFTSDCRDFFYEQKTLDLPNRLRASAANSIELLSSNEFEEIRIAVPLNVKERTIGYLLFGEKKSDLAYSRADFEFADSIAMQSAIAIENKRLSEEASENERIKEEIELAKKIQLGLLPREAPALPNLDLYGFYNAAEDVGGDYYDYFYRKAGDKTTHVTAVIGDVSGKGISASLYMTRFQGVMSSLFYSGNPSPKELLAETNAAVRRDIAKNSFVTCLTAEFDLANSIVRFSRAGHLPLIVYSKAENRAKDHLGKGIGLGIGDESLFASTIEEQELQLAAGDIAVLISDGVSEAMNSAEDEFGTSGVASVLEKHADKSAGRIGAELLDAIHAFTGSSLPQDDITFIIAKVE